MATLSRGDLLAYLRSHRYGVVATVGLDGFPQSALMGLATTDALELIFDTTSATRKHANLLRDPRVSVVFTGPAEQTVQYEGLAAEVSTIGASDASYRDAYYSTFPEGRERTNWPNLAYWRISPGWIRYSDFARGPLITEFRFDRGI